MIERLEHVVRAVAEWLIVARLTATEIECAVTVGSETSRLKTGTFVRAVAEWLVFGAAAGAPKVGFTSFERNLIRPFLGDHRFIRHADSLGKLD
jgi:hypothetical protein